MSLVVSPLPPSDATCPQRHDLPESQWSLVDWYLEEQGRLSAVEQFARVHEQISTPVYRTLLPAKPPGPGEQYAFEVDLDRCSGCKACVTACHSLNGLDDAETWRDVGLLTGGNDQRPFQQHVTTTCHHCLEPACLEVCPTLAYEKNSVTGIVRHLDDQCFGCQYCILACPYNVPRYNARLGIVRKCDMCSQRLSAGEAPACVQACPHEAIRIHVVNLEQVKADAETSQFLPGTPDAQYTLPTTNYQTAHSWPRNVLPADYFRVQTEHAHGPLVAMLVLTQMSVGGLLIMALAGLGGGFAATDSVRACQTAICLGACYLGLCASLMHLGRPWLAYRAILGLRTSWLSREILAFGLYAGGATWLTWQTLFSAESLPMLEWFTVGTGVAGVFCSAMIYHRTRRPFWNVYQTGARFGLTTLLLGLAVTWVSLASISPGAPGRAALLWSIVAAASLKGVSELGGLAALFDRPQTALKRTALLLIGPLRRSLILRYVALGIATILAASLFPSVPAETRLELFASLVCLGSLTWGEWLSRSLFFKASVAFRMPGGPSA